MWSGRPVRRLPGRGARELAPLLLTLGWLLVTAYVASWALDRDFGLPWGFLAPLVPLALAGYNGLRLARAYRAYASRTYALTPEHAILLRPGERPLRLPLAELREVSYAERRGGVGTVVLGPTNRAAEILRRSTSRARGRVELAPAFEDVADAREVYERLEALRSRT